MIDKDNAYFHPQELYLLAAAADCKEIFGLADQKVFQLLGKNFKYAEDRLKEKKLFKKDGDITRQAAVVIEVLKMYSQSKKYVQIYNLTFAFLEKSSSNIIILKEVKKNEEYSIHMVNKLIALKLIFEKYSTLKREALEDEKSFLNIELTPNEIEELTPTEPWKDATVFVFYGFNDLKTKDIRKASKHTMVTFEREEKLFTIDFESKKFFRTSQQFLVKKIFDEFDMPYEEAEVSSG